MRDLAGAAVGLVILVVIGLCLLSTAIGVGDSFSLESRGECDRNTIVHVGGHFPHDVDECSYKANVLRKIAP